MIVILFCLPGIGNLFSGFCFRREITPFHPENLAYMFSIAFDFKSFISFFIFGVPFRLWIPVSIKELRNWNSSYVWCLYLGKIPLLKTNCSTFSEFSRLTRDKCKCLSHQKCHLAWATANPMTGQKARRVILNKTMRERHDYERKHSNKITCLKFQKKASKLN